MRSLLQSSAVAGPASRKGRMVIECLALGLAVLTLSTAALAQGGGFGGSGGQGGIGGRPGGGIGGPGGGEITSAPAADKPDAAAKKYYNAGKKSLAKAAEYEAAAALAPNEDKKNAALEKQNDSYGRALDQFTAALSNQGDLYDAWNCVGYIHLRLGAYAESVDDYNHTLAMKPDLMEAIEHRAEAYMAIDRLDEAKRAYMEVFNHEPKLADRLMVTMQRWVTEHRADAHGMRVSDIDGFDKWMQERDGIAKQTASLPH